MSLVSQPSFAACLARVCMLVGKRFRLKAPAQAMENFKGRMFACTIPAGTILEVVSEAVNEGDRMVDVRWEHRRATLFEVDLSASGTEMRD